MAQSKAKDGLTIVYQYGVHYKWVKDLPEEVMTQLRLAHQLRERLVDITLTHEAEKNAIWAESPEIAEMDEQIVVAESRKQQVKSDAKDENSKQRRRDAVGPVAEEAEKIEKTEQANLRKLRQKRREKISAAYENVPGVRERIYAANEKRQKDRQKARRESIDQGLTHDTARQVVENHTSAEKAISAKRANGEVARFSHHPFDGTGSLYTFTRRRSNNKANDQSPIGIADINGPHRNTFCLPYLDPEGWKKMTRGQRKRAGRVAARFRIRNGSDGATEVPVELHRPLPANARVTQASLTFTREGTRRRADLNVVVTLPAPDPVEDTSSCAIHFGWRKERDGSVRTMTFAAETPLKAWEDVAGNPRYPALNEVMSLSDDLCSGTVTLPEHWVDKIRTGSELQSECDHAFNEVKQELSDWLASVGGTDHPRRTDAEGNSEQLTAGVVSRWKNPKRLVWLAYDWRDTPPAEPGGEEIAAQLEAWRAFDKKLIDSLNGADGKARRRRNDVYSQVAALFVDSYAHIYMDKVNHADLTELPNQDEGIPKELARKLGRQRASTAAATLRSKIESTARKYGVTTERIEAQAVSTLHAACGTQNIRVGGQMRILCCGCGQRYDVDENAVTIIDTTAAEAV